MDSQWYGQTAVGRPRVWRIAPLAMAHRAHDLRRALDANVNGTRMHNRTIVYVRVCIICTYAHVAPHCGFVWCGRQDGAYAVAVGVMAHELVVACSACAQAL